jgi:hypothetical protein
MTAAVLKRGVAAVRDVAADIDTEASLDALAAHDAQPDEIAPTPVRPRKSRPFSALAAEILAFARMPRWSWGFAQLDRAAPVPMGSLVYIIGATGRGKSALVLWIARDHALKLGPAIVFSAELAGAIAGARSVAQVTDATWFQVVSGGLSEAEIAAALDVAKLRIVDEVTESWAVDIETEILAAQAEHPGEIVLVTIDYLQILRCEGRDPRAQVTAASARLRDIAKRTGAVILALSKASRATARGLRSGDLLGSDATEAGAESNGIEHDAIAQVQLGAMKPANPDDPDDPVSIVDVSVSKSRFGRADVVIPFAFDGAHGTFREAGDAVSAAERKAAKATGDDADKLHEVTLKIRGFLVGVREAMSRGDIADGAKGNRKLALKAIGEMVKTGELVEVMGRQRPVTRRGETFWPLAQASRLADLGLRPAKGAA